MKPYVWPSSDEAAPPTSARRTFPRESTANYGTLNIFSSSCPAPDVPASAAVAAVSVTGERGIRHYRSHNAESTATRQFPVFGHRRVSAPRRGETPHRMRHVRDAAGAQQHVQVVNITDAYKDPMQMGPQRTGVKCVPQKSSSHDVGAALAFANAPQQLSARELATPVGRPSCPPVFAVDFTAQERFAQAVRDHAQQRTRGVAEFYVQLVRNTVGGVTSSTPKPTIIPWSLDEAPARQVLTLERCRDQLVALTAMPISLQDFADLLWGSGGGGDVDAEAPLPLQHRPVPFRDFAVVFGQNSSDARLARMRV
ncbi:hypothetical protein NESM_000506800 [Novymonas esmeraldas]|uniref:Uncharacterized protein n=1 Tax=Novymonas esmeraldas TaxID=1808958 RepID=A0AAW0ERA4_9TRYP